MLYDNLWAPWRMSYIRQLGGAEPQGQPQKPPVCFLCEAIQNATDEASQRERLVLLSDPRGMLILNRYPYVTGHLLIAPRDHVGTLEGLSPQQRADLMELTALAERVVQASMNPQGMNIGINLGRCAGAGLPGHLHVHVVPRWNGDTNFMDVVGRVRVIPQALEETYERMRESMKCDVRSAK